MAIFYMDVKIIGRSSGRSAVGAAAYRSGEKLRSLEHASYQSGEKLQGKDGKITHDYRRKKGVVHSEIMLPDNTPPEYSDRETLWNAVEKSEKRKDSQLAREFIVALPKEYNFSEQLTVIRQYSQENFVNIGICADFAIHHNDGNTHAHIMLTTRSVSRDGFGLKNTDWNKKEKLMEWREAWARINNTMLERKGLDERIDHRTLKTQGLDREPMVHLGHEATALEKKGIRTQRGDYNREIQRRNEIRAIKEEIIDMKQKQELAQIQLSVIEIQQRQNEIIQRLERMSESTQDSTATVPNELITKLETANRVSNSQDALDKPLERKLNSVENAKQRRPTRRSYIKSIINFRLARAEYNVLYEEVARSDTRVEEIKGDIQNIDKLSDISAQIEDKWQSLHFWNWIKEKKHYENVKQARLDVRNAVRDFEQKYRFMPDQAPAEIEKILQKMQPKRAELAKKETEVSKLSDAMRENGEKYRSQYKFMVKLPRKFPDPAPPPIDPATGWQNRRELLKHFAITRENAKKREELRQRVKLRKILMISSPEQKKRRLADVIGKYRRGIVGEPLFSNVTLSQKKV